MSSHPDRLRRRFLHTIIATAAVTAVALSLPSAADATGATTRTPSAGQSVAARTYIVQLTVAPSKAEVVRSVRTAVVAAGGKVTSEQPAIGMLVVTLRPAAVNTIARLDGVKAVSPDAKAHPMSLGFDPSTQPGSMTNVTKITQAQYFWNQGITGAGIDVAVIDTGLTPVPGLADSGKVVVGPDLSFEGQSLNLRYLDTYGHGTAMGSIIAGREGAKQANGYLYAQDTGHYYGMAPDSRLVDIKVGSADGSVDVSQLIGAIDWVVQDRDNPGAGANLNIKVLNLSFGTDSTQSWQVDPLSQAAEVATRNGILVIAAAGNDGDSTVGLADPAYNPHILAVGAVDTKGTTAFADDSVPSFSQHSDATRNVTRSPDLVAPGVGIVSASVPGSNLATTYPGALLGAGNYIRGSGTSQAAAVVSGAAALLFQKYPSASALQIQAILETSTSQVGTSVEASEGRGELNLQRAWTTALPSSSATAAAMLNMTGQTASGTGTLQGARGTQSVSIDGKTLTGEKDIFGVNWDTTVHADLAVGRLNWSGSGGLLTGSLNGNYWIGTGFQYETTSAAAQAWGGRSWAATTWTANAWSGNPWTGRTWAGRTWSGRTWAGNSWGNPVTNVGGNWASRTWASSSWK
jgi:serine protease AprX